MMNEAISNFCIAAPAKVRSTQSISAETQCTALPSVVPATPGSRMAKAIRRWFGKIASRLDQLFKDSNYELTRWKAVEYREKDYIDYWREYNLYRWY